MRGETASEVATGVRNLDLLGVTGFGVPHDIPASYWHSLRSGGHACGVCFARGGHPFTIDPDFGEVLSWRSSMPGSLLQVVRGA